MYAKLLDFEFCPTSLPHSLGSSPGKCKPTPSKLQLIAYCHSDLNTALATSLLIPLYVGTGGWLQQCYWQAQGLDQRECPQSQDGAEFVLVQLQPQQEQEQHAALGKHTSSGKGSMGSQMFWINGQYGMMTEETF